MTEKYYDKRNWIKEALTDTDNMSAAGHDVQHGVCSPDCKACEPYRTSPDEEYEKIVGLLKKKLKGPPRQKIFAGEFAINRTALNELSQHPKVHVEKTKHLPVIVSVSLSVENEDGHAAANVRGLAPLQAQQKAYTPHSLPAPMPWTESGGEGVNPFRKGVKNER